MGTAKDAPKQTALTVTIRLTPTEKEALDFLAYVFEETTQESIESYVKQGITSWLCSDDVGGTQKARTLYSKIRKEKAAAEKAAIEVAV